MLRILILAFVANLALSHENVVIKYEAPLLAFTWPTSVKGINQVIFYYFVNNAAFQGRGVLTTSRAKGWLFRTRDVKVDGADRVEAYAIAYDVKNNILLMTPNSTLVLSTASSATKGWQFQTRDVKVDGAERFEVSTVAYDVRNTTLLRTPNTTLALNDYRSTTQLPVKMIRGAVIFRDDFDSLNSRNWRYEVSMFGGNNGEFQVYTNDPRNVFIKDGKLTIQPITTIRPNDPRFDEYYLQDGIMDVEKLWGSCTNVNNDGCFRTGKDGLLPPVMSGKIMSIPTLRYGIVEVRARIPKGDWLWPAIWMLPRDSVYGGWPRSGEIDLMVSRGNDIPQGIGTISSMLHWGISRNNNKFPLTYGERTGKSWHDSYHNWKLEWTPDYINIFVDDQRILEVKAGNGFWDKGQHSGPNIWASGEKMAPFDQDFYLIFNVAVGGTNGYFPDNINWGKRKPWTNNSTRAAEDFWNARNEWLPTWQGDKSALLIDWVEFRSL